RCPRDAARRRDGGGNGRSGGARADSRARPDRQHGRSAGAYQVRAAGGPVVREKAGGVARDGGGSAPARGATSGDRHTRRSHRRRRQTGAGGGPVSSFGSEAKVVAFRPKNRITQRQITSQQHGPILHRVDLVCNTPITPYGRSAPLGAVLARTLGAVRVPNDLSVRRDHEKRPCNFRPRRAVGAAVDGGRRTGQQPKVQERSPGCACYGRSTRSCWASQEGLPGSGAASGAAAAASGSGAAAAASSSGSFAAAAASSSGSFAAATAAASGSG